MFLSDIIAELYGAGYSPEAIEDVQKYIFETHPAARAEMAAQPMNTAQPDPDIPDDFVDRLIKELEK